MAHWLSFPLVLLGTMAVLWTGLSGVAADVVRSGGGIPVEGVKTFGTAIKGFSLSPGVEATLFQYVPTAETACLTAMWFTGEIPWEHFGDLRVRIYVDNETVAGIDMRLSLGHGIGFLDITAPWGTSTMGKLAIGGGIYNTHRIPFGQEV